MRPRTVVLVEDDEGMRIALERVLEIAGYRVDSFASAEDCLSSGAVARADCLVCDVHLPGQSGFDLGRCVAQGGRTIPVIFITAHELPAARAEAERLGAADYLMKPFDARTLVRAVHAATHSR